MPAVVDKLGPGTVSIGEVGTAVDFSCQVTAAQVEWDVSQDDPTTVLCGESVPGAMTFSATFSGTLFQDLSSADVGGGIVEYSWAHKGESVPLTFVPSTTAGKQVTGTVTLVPLTVGGDEAGANMTSDFEWAFVGDPVLGDAAPAGLEATSRKTSKSDAAA